MNQTFLRLSASHTLREALGILLDPEAPESAPRVLIVLNPNGSFAGTLSALSLLRALAPEWTESATEDDEQGGPGAERHAGGEDTAPGKQMLHAMQDRLNLKVGHAVNSNVPAVSPDERLERLIQLIHQRHLDCLPVLDGGRVVGVVYVADIFNAAASLALQAHPA
jgi:Mg/Co/Ni transporter MgtE